MSAETDIQLCSRRCSTFKHPREHTGYRRKEGIACKVLQGVHAPACVRLQGRCTSDCASRAVKVSLFMPRTHTLIAFVPAPCVCTCVQGSPQAPPFSRPPAIHFMGVCHQIQFPSCKLALLQALSTEITLSFAVTAGDTVAGWPSFSRADVGIA